MVRDRAGAWRVDARPPLVEIGVAARNRSSAHGRMESRRSGGRFASGCGGLGSGGLRDDGGHHGLDKHAVAHGAVKVSLALDAAIVLPRLLLELDADPFAHLEVSRARKPHNSLAAIVEQDGLPRLEVRHYVDRSEGRCCIMRLAAVGNGRLLVWFSEYFACLLSRLTSKREFDSCRSE